MSWLIPETGQRNVRVVVCGFADNAAVGLITERIMYRVLYAVICSLFCTGVYAAPQEASPRARIIINEVNSSIVLGSDQNTRLLRLALRVSLTNESVEPITVVRNQFQLFANGQTVTEAAPEAGDDFVQKTVQQKQAASGWLWFSGIPLNGEETPLTLQWTLSKPRSLDAKSEPGSSTDLEEPKEESETQPDPADAVTVNLTQELRKLNAVEKWRIGPDGELQVLAVHRDLDVLAAWSIVDELKNLSAGGIQRLLLVPASGTQPAVTDEFSLWLTSMTEGGTATQGQPLPVPMPRAEVTFKSVSLASFPEVAGRPFRSGRRGVQQFRNVDDAVSTALTPLYRFVPVEQAIADLSNSHAGIRRAAMAGAVDRLTAEQATAILERAHSGSESLQLEVASYLNLIPGRASVDALREMCLGDNAKVSAAALRSLAQSRDESAEDAMAEIWKAGRTTPALQSAMVEAIVESLDDRWLPLVADYVSDFLQQATQPDSATIPVDSIAGALLFLHKRDGATTDAEVRKQILNVRNPSIQDIFLQHLMQTNQPANEAIIRECVTTRLDEGQISPVVASAAAVYRDPAWTDALLTGFTLAKNDNRASPQFFHAALECASNEQLDKLAQKLDGFNVNQRAELLQHLARTNHPNWRTCAAQLLTKPNERCSEVIQLLAQDASEESLLILRNRLESYVAGLEGTSDASVEGQHFFQTLMVHLSMFVHPECRRVVNRMSRNASVYVSERAARLKADSFRRSPAFRLMLTETQQRRDGKNAEADQTLNDCLDLDPLLPEIYVRRASMRMHAEQFAESMVDLKMADQLSPEDIEVQSMIGLVMVRLDDISNGLQFAEETIAMAPQDWTSLYNGACTFARATESKVPTPEDRQKFADRAIELLRQTAVLKFNDSEHMLKDADLFSLHQHAEWQNIVGLVNANKDPAPEAPQKDQ